MSIKDVIDNTGIPGNEFENAENPVLPVSEVPVKTGFSIPFKEIIFCETGPEDDYINHPLNFARSEGLGQMIRGVTGYLRKFANVDSLKLAILDIIFGYMKFKREKGAANERSNAAASA